MSVYMYSIILPKSMKLNRYHTFFKKFKKNTTALHKEIKAQVHSTSYHSFFKIYFIPWYFYKKSPTKLTRPFSFKSVDNGIETISNVTNMFNTDYWIQLARGNVQEEF